MSFQIDQSGKIELTSKPTVIALANGKTITIKITSTEKIFTISKRNCHKRALAVYQQIEKPKIIVKAEEVFVVLHLFE